MCSCWPSRRAIFYDAVAIAEPSKNDGRRPGRHRYPGKWQRDTSSAQSLALVDARLLAAALAIPIEHPIHERHAMTDGKVAVVKIEDRGPFAATRVMDVTPKVAQELAMTERGVAPVEVKPITVPRPNRETKLGAGAAELTPQQIREADGAAASR
jgi:peptidoglycan lytic transglycosylase